MKLLLFFGSGISFESGLPQVEVITNKLLFCDWQSHSDSNFYIGAKHPGIVDGKVARQQKFLRLLSSLAETYFREKGLFRRKINYEDLYHLVQQIEFDLENGIHNPAVGKFIADLRSVTEIICTPIGGEIDFNLARLAEEAARFICCGVWLSLKMLVEPKGLSCLTGLLKSEKISKLDVVTLNHDLILEAVIGMSGIDGFVEQDGDYRLYSDKWFDDESHNRVRLVKLHGSINWWRSLETLHYFVPLKNSLLECKTSDGKRLSSHPRPEILIGSHNKLLNYRFGIFANLHFRFYQLLREHKTIVMSGYSWNDIGINSWLSEWFYSSAEKRLLLLHHKQLDEIVFGISTIFQWRFRQLVDSDQIVLIQKWFSETTAEDLLDEIRG